MQHAQRGSEDGVLLVETGKDLLEATASDVITEEYEQYPQQANFPTLLGHGFIAVGIAIPKTPAPTGEPPQRRVERSLFEAGSTRCAIRNGTGHGRPFVPSVDGDEARATVQLIGAALYRTELNC